MWIAYTTDGEIVAFAAQPDDLAALRGDPVIIVEPGPDDLSQWD